VQGSYLRFYVHENRKHHGILLYEWLLEQAKKMGIHGGSAFRAIAGFGRHGVLHEAHFFELAGDLTVEVEFIVNENEAKRLFELIREQKIRLFYARVPIEYGTLNAEIGDA
jgi:PII-like signaling protein